MLGAPVSAKSFTILQRERAVYCVKSALSIDSGFADEIDASRSSHHSSCSHAVVALQSRLLRVYSNIVFNERKQDGP